jgi:hypothetical protein
MKIFLLFILTLCFGFYVKSQNNFSIGYKEGFPIGYCYYAGLGCIPPITPIVPMPILGESTTSYTDGYNRGLLEGIKKYNDVKSASVYSKSSSNLTNYTIPQVIPEYKPFTPDFEFYQKAMAQKQIQTKSNSNASQSQKEAEIQRIVNNYTSAENVELRKQFIKLVKTQYNSFSLFPNILPNGTYDAIIITEPPIGQEKPYPTIQENCRVIVQDNKIIGAMTKNFLTGEDQITYNRQYFPSLVLKDLDGFIEQSYSIEKGRGSYKWSAYNGYKYGLTGTTYQVYLNDYLSKYNTAQLMIIQLKNKYNAKSSFPKVSDGWHTAYLTNNIETCSLRNVYVENGKVVKWVGSNGNQNMVDSGGLIVNCKATVSIIWPPLATHTFYSGTFMVKSNTEIFDIYFIDL